MILRHSVLYLLARGVPALVGFATIIIFTRLLSPEAYGQYTLIVTGSLLVNVILYQWLSASLLRFLPQYRDNEVDLLAAILSGYLFMSFLAGMGGALLVLLWEDPEWNKLISIGIPLVWMQAWFAINLELVRGRLAPFRYGLVSMLKAVVALGFGVILVLLGYDAYGALTGLLMGLIVAGLWSAWGQWIPFKKWRFNWGLVKKLLSYGLPLTASFALAIIISSTDRFMLAVIIDESATGLYAAGQGLAQQAVGVLMTMVNLAAYPLILRTLEDTGPDAARSELRKNVILLLGIGFPVTTIFITLSPNIAKIFLGGDFQAAGIELMPWFAVATLLASARAYYFDLAFYLGKRTRIQIIVMGSAALLNFGLNIWFIPVYGLLGAVYASVVAHAIAVILSAILGNWAFRLPAMHGDFIRLLIAALVMAVALYIVPSDDSAFGLLLSITVGGSVYLGCILAMDLGGIRHDIGRYIVHGATYVKELMSR